MSSVFIEHDNLEDAKIDERIWRIQFGETHDVILKEMPGGKFRVTRTPKAAASSDGHAAATGPQRLRTSDVTHPGATEDRLTPLLDLIGEAETNDHYNAIFGDEDNTDPNLLVMSVDDVIKFQRDFVRRGSPSSACGRYQILRGTLKDLKKRLAMDGTELFDEPGQDILALELLQRRGLDAYLVGSITRDRFIDNLAMEWAALPNTTGKSHFHGDGLNKARVSLSELEAAIEVLRQ